MKSAPIMFDEATSDYVVVLLRYELLHLWRGCPYSHVSTSRMDQTSITFEYLTTKTAKGRIHVQ